MPPDVRLPSLGANLAVARHQVTVLGEDAGRHCLDPIPRAKDGTNLCFAWQSQDKRRSSFSVCLPNCGRETDSVHDSAYCLRRYSEACERFEGTDAPCRWALVLFFISRHMKEAFNVSSGLLESLPLWYHSGWRVERLETRTSCPYYS